MRYFIYCRKSQEAEDRQILSLESQEMEMGKLASTFNGEIVSAYAEARTARSTGRPLFDEMLDRVERGDADGILAWHPDRLARNAVDGGRIIHLLDAGKLKDLRFATANFENSPSGKLMLSVLFSFSKYYVDSLAENVRRGMRTKAEKGWRPSKPPLGYLTDPVTRLIVPDPTRFPIVQRMWRLALTGAYSYRQIWIKAVFEWGLRTKERKKSGGTLVSFSTVQSIFKNPFYAGVFEWNQRTFPGKHESMVSLDDYQRVQTYRRRAANPRAKTRNFAFSGMIRCGACGLSVTAEEHTNRYGKTYGYYHCTRKRLPKCREPSIRVETLEADIVAFLRSVSLPDELAEALDRAVREQAAPQTAFTAATLASLDAAIAKLTKETDNLALMCARGFISEEEFLRQRHDSELKRLQLADQRQSLDQPIRRFEPFAELKSLCGRAANCFSRLDANVQRLILKTVGSNPTLADKKLSIQARFPVFQWPTATDRSTWCTIVSNIRTRSVSHDPEFLKTLEQLHEINEAIDNLETIERVKREQQLAA